MPCPICRQFLFRPRNLPLPLPSNHSQFAR
ncbi:MAG: hypothetical protein EBT45_08700 [Alphaproteobacteria bacterium]|nr:hypothetical protein [Alphaproteobacteria bacterium]